MTDEIRVEEKHECFCKSKGFRKFMTIAGGTFVGAFLAMSLFAALHKPPMPAPMPCPCKYHHQMVRPYDGPHHFDKWDKGPRGDFHRDKGERKFGGKFDDKFGGKFEEGRKFPPRADRQVQEIDD